MIIMYKNSSFFDVLLLITLLALPLMSHAQAKENGRPSLDDTLQWISDNLKNYHFGHYSAKFTYLEPIIDGCKITVTHKIESLSGELYGVEKRSGMLSDINPERIIIEESDSFIPINLNAYLKQNSTLFDHQSYSHSTKKISNHEFNSLVILFHNLTFANRFKKAIAHAATLCAQQELSEPRKNKDLF